jgi:DNA mismatch repair ATPase MutS
VGVEADLKRVKNYHFTVKETGRDVIFLRRLVPGATVNIHLEPAVPENRPRN